jgi:hypothetical protein
VPAGGVEQCGALVDADDGRASAGQPAQRAHLDPGAAAEGQDPSSLGEG